MMFMREKTIGLIVVIFMILSVFFMGCTDGNIPPVASLNIMPSSPDVNTTIFVESTSTDEDGIIVNTTWFLDNEIISYDQNLSFKLNNNGTYILKLVVIDDNDASDSIQRTIVIGESNDVKELLIGTWQNEANGQTGTWIFYQNNTLKSTWQGDYGALVVDYWEYSINGSELCFNNPSDQQLDVGCYFYSFSDDYAVLTVTYDGNSAEWIKID